MKKFIAILTVLVVCAGLCGCGNAKFQKYYDLGMKYIEQENYEEAVIAFTSAIDIDPKSAPAHEGRGDAYVALGEWDKAIADYEVALTLDGTNAELYIKLGDAYLADGEGEKSREILADGFQITGDERLSNSMPAPDEASAAAFFNNTLKNLEPSLWLQSIPQDLYANGLPAYYAMASAEPVDIYSNGKPKNGDILSYLTAEELQTVNADMSAEAGIYRTSDMQDFIDSIWGANRIDMKNNVYGDTLVFTTSKGFAFIGYGYGSDPVYVAFRIVGFETSDTASVLVIEALQVDMLWQEVYDMGSYMDGTGAQYEIIGNYAGQWNYGDSDAALWNMAAGKQLKQMDVVVYNTKDGVRLWGAFAHGKAEFPS